MKLIWKLWGMFLVALGDFASGILITHILIQITGYQGLPILALYVIGATLAVLPDLDILIQLGVVSNKSKDISNHREILHRPLLALPIFISLYFFVSAFWAWLVGLCLLAHFIHDSTGSGYGVKWFRPFSQNTYKFCTQRIICKWTPEEVTKNPFTMKLDDWLEKYYLKPTLERCAGIILAFIALIIILIW